MSAKESSAEEPRMEEQGAERERRQERRMDVQSEVALTLIDAMERGDTPWQKPWNSQSMRPRNCVTGNSYRGINRILLSLAGGNGLFVTYQQAQGKGWQVRQGEKGTMIIRIVDLDQKTKDDGRQPEKSTDGRTGKPRNVVLRRYYVFGSHQIDGMPEPATAADLDFDPIERAEAVLTALKEKTDLRIIHGKREACYVPATDEVHLPNKKSFKSVYDYYATAFHEAGGHATLHAKRLDRREAIAKRWGDEAYAMEELRAEITSAILAAETGVQSTDAHRQKHLANHAAYLKSWIKVLSNDSMAIFSAAKDAEKMSDYVLSLERQASAMQEHKEWIADYDRAP